MPGLAEPLALLCDREELLGVPLPAALEASYGGPLRLSGSIVYANFVSSLDGVVALPSLVQSSALIADRSEADRFVMALLRSCADVVLVGSGTLRASPTSLWTGERVFPDAAPELGALREELGLAPVPKLAVLTASGEVDVAHPALDAGALVLTTARGAAHLGSSLPDASEAIVLEGSTEVDLRAAIDLLRHRGYGRILSEAGPTVLGSLLASGVLDELFLTLSPLLAGRGRPEHRPGLVEGRAFLPETRLAGRLLDARRHRQHLFLRYRID